MPEPGVRKRFALCSSKRNFRLTSGMCWTGDFWLLAESVRNLAQQGRQGGAGNRQKYRHDYGRYQCDDHPSFHVASFSRSYEHLTAYAQAVRLILVYRALAFLGHIAQAVRTRNAHKAASPGLSTARPTGQAGLSPLETTTGAGVY